MCTFKKKKRKQNKKMKKPKQNTDNKKIKINLVCMRRFLA